MDRNELVRVDTNILPKAKLIVVFCGLAFSLLICFIDQNSIGIGTFVPSTPMILCLRPNSSTHHRDGSPLSDHHRLGGNVKFDCKHGFPGPLWTLIGYRWKEGRLPVSCWAPSCGRPVVWVCEDGPPAVCLPRHHWRWTGRDHGIDDDDRIGCGDA